MFRQSTFGSSRGDGIKINGHIGSAEHHWQLSRTPSPHPQTPHLNLHIHIGHGGDVLMNKMFRSERRTDGLMGRRTV